MAKPKWKAIEVPKKRGKRMSREEVIATPLFQRAWKRMQQTMNPPKRCVHGHDLTKPENVGVASVLWSGKPRCQICWEKSASKLHSAKPAAKKIAAIPRQRTGKKEANLIDLIAKSVAAATLSDAQVIPAARTREQLWNQIQSGVRAGVRQIGFRPPAS